MEVLSLQRNVIEKTEHYGIIFLRYAVAVVYIWFGALKLIGFSPATELVEKTVYWFNPTWFLPLLAIWEITIGICFLHKRLIPFGILLLLIHMPGTFLPFLLLPQVTFQNGNPFYLTMEGQYIVKNLLIIAAAIVIGGKIPMNGQSDK